MGRIQESALLDDWLYGGYIEGCVDVVVSNKGANNWGWRCKNTSLKVFVGNPTIFIAINGGIYCWLQSTDMVSLTQVFADVWTTERQINNVRILMSECFCQNLINVAIACRSELIAVLLGAIDTECNTLSDVLA